MTREEKIRYNEIEEAERFAPCDSFISGALWADEHPRKGLVDIEKAWEWIEDNLLSSNQQDKSRLYCEKFINYMKGE